MDKRHNEHQADPHACEECNRLSRRQFLTRSGLAAAGAATLPAWMPRIARANPLSPTQDIVVNVFLRGAMDGITMIVPHGEPNFYDPVLSPRPTLAVPPPGQPNGAIDIDGFFGFNPNATGLDAILQDNDLALIHASGSTDPTRSHFLAMTNWEFATPNQSNNIGSGWLARHLQTVNPVGDPLRGAVLDNQVVQAFAQAPQTLPIDDPDSFSFPGNPATANLREAAMASLYHGAFPPLGPAADTTFDTIDMLEAIDFGSYVPSNGAVYPGGSFGDKFKATAQMIKEGTDIEAYEIDIGGWDHHNNQGPITGTFANLCTTLSDTLRAFHLDMGGYWGNLNVMVQTEFGRKVAENGSAGTDHGHGGVMMIISGNVTPGMHGAWPGLAPGQLNLGDLAITTDFRDVIGELVTKRLCNGANLATILPNHTYVDQNIFV